MRRLSITTVWLFIALLAGSVVLACSGASPASRPISDTGTSSDTQDRELSGNPKPEQPENPAPDQVTADAALIIHTGTLNLEVTDLRPAIDQANALIAGLGGQVDSSHESNSDGRQTATVTYRIPAARWTEALTGLRTIGQRVVSEDTEAADVTAQVIDLDARIANLRSTEAALQSIMGTATTITDVLKVQAELTKVRSDIESMTAQRDHLADQAALGTLEVGFNVPVAEASVATNGWDLGHEIDSAVAALVRVGQGTASVAVWLLIVFLPVAIPLLIVLYVALRIRRRMERRASGPATPAV
jgi:hypothetical protein